MKYFVLCLLSALFLLTFGMTAQAADEVKKTSDKNVGTIIADDVKEVKKEFNKTVDTTKEAVVRDAKAMKEDIPKGLKEAKDEAVKISKEVKEGTTKEFKEMRDNMANPSLKPKTESK